MLYYRLYYFSPRIPGIVKFDEIQAADDGAARAVADARQGEHALELWCGHRMVAQIEARDPATRRNLLRGNGDGCGLAAG